MRTACLWCRRPDSYCQLAWRLSPGRKKQGIGMIAFSSLVSQTIGSRMGRPTQNYEGVPTENVASCTCTSIIDSHLYKKGHRCDTHDLLLQLILRRAWPPAATRCTLNSPFRPQTRNPRTLSKNFSRELLRMHQITVGNTCDHHHNRSTCRKKRTERAPWRSGDNYRNGTCPACPAKAGHRLPARPSPEQTLPDG